jgi:pimeloyl-ACP methyl ester carboxylesterase
VAPPNTGAGPAARARPFPQSREDLLSFTQQASDRIYIQTLSWGSTLAWDAMAKHPAAVITDVDELWVTPIDTS